MAAKYQGNGDMSLSMAEKMGLNCPVCLEVYKEPKSLACLHTFCEICIHSYVMKMKENGTLKDGIECPLCRKTTLTEIKDSPPEEWTASFPSNYAILSVLDALHSGDKDDSKNTPICQPCQQINITREASKYCPNCQEYQCAECVKVHKRFASLKRHELLEVDASNRSFKSSPDFGKLVQCNVHAKPIKYYCDEHSKLCCSGCAIITHRQCKSVVEIQEMTGNVERKNTLKTQLIELRDKLKLTSNHFQTCDKEIEHHISALPDKIETVRAKFDKIVDDLKEKVLKEAALMKKQKSLEFSENHTECESLIAVLETTLCIHEDVVNHGTPSQLFIARHKIEEQLSMYEQKAEEQFSKLQSFNITVNLQIVKHKDNVSESGKDTDSLTVITTKESINSIMEHEPVKLELESWTAVKHSEKLKMDEELKKQEHEKEIVKDELETLKNEQKNLLARLADNDTAINQYKVRMEKEQKDLQTQLAEKDTTITQNTVKLQQQASRTERAEKELEILKKKDCVLGESISQWVSSVRSFSTEFRSGGFKAKQVVGPPTVYPKYGHHFGVWAQNTRDANQYITVVFDKRVMVTGVDIYETHNAGGVKQISAMIQNTETGNLDVFPLYTCPEGGIQVMKQSRIFSPTLQNIGKATNTIRVNVDCSVAQSWVGIDAIQLHGNRVGASGKT